jgi:LysM repeat protein
VQRNENLNAIADRYGITKEELMDKNCLGSPSIEPGEILYVPPAPPVPTQRPCAPYPGWSYPYQVRVGDTLGSIARRAGVSVAQIMHANCMNTDTIRVGKIIFLPGYIPPPPLPTLPVEPTEPPPPTERPTDPPPPTPEPTERPTEPPPPTPEPTERPVPTDLPPTQPPPAP